MNKYKLIITALIALVLVPSIALASVTSVKYGQKNSPQVKELQAFLKAQGVYSGPVNGNFLTLTRAALKKFQTKIGLSPNGVLDQLTLSLISEIENGNSNARYTPSAPSNNSSSTTIPTIQTSSALDLKKLPLGDNKYSQDSPKKGYLYVCHVSTDGGGAGTKGPWINGTTWDSTSKLSVAGDVAWPNAKFTSKVEGSNRVFTGNNLPISHNTGKFPIANSDPAYSYDKNPNTIKEQTLTLSLPENPTVASKPGCIAGMVGISVTGVTIYSAFDAQMRDAVAHEVQDKCDGHPQQQSQYHYHSLSDCIKDSRSGINGSSDLIGYAFDGFGIYGSYENGKELTTNDLDECHGKTSEVMWDGKKVNMYHYVATKDFPYTVSCFKGTSYEPKPSGGTGGQMPNGQGANRFMPPR